MLRFSAVPCPAALRTRVVLHSPGCVSTVGRVTLLLPCLGVAWPPGSSRCTAKRGAQRGGVLSKPAAEAARAERDGKGFLVVNFVTLYTPKNRA